MKIIRRLITVFTAALLVMATLMNFVGCSIEISAENLTEGIEPEVPNALSDLSALAPELTDFSLKLYTASVKSGENSVMSPISVINALGMIFNGAEGETREEMERVLGVSAEALNLYMYSYLNSLPSSEKCKLSIANSIWLSDRTDFEIKSEFLRKTVDYYASEVYRAPFNRQTLADMNNWIKLKTDGIIPRALTDISSSAVTYLINTVLFDAEWSSVYEKHQVRDGDFTNADGSVSEVKFMHSTEGRYIEGDGAIGFMKYYSGGKYAFAAILPPENMSAEEYLASIDGEGLNKLLTEAVSTTVIASMPKFECEYSGELSEVLSGLGMPTAFDVNRADFTSFGESESGNIFISKVIHKAKISVTEKGTRAGAVTVLEMDCGAGEPIEPKTVTLDSPYVYMLIDCDSYIPFFMGSVNRLN